MSGRLSWRRSTTHRGYVAYPEGLDATERRALIEYYQPANSWQWKVVYDGALLSGIKSTTQECADAANEAWPAVIEKAAAMKARQDWEAAHWELVRKIEAGELPPEHFANAAAERENLMWVMDRIKPKSGFGAVSAGVQRLVDAISRELYRRRTGRRDD